MEGSIPPWLRDAPLANYSPGNILGLKLKKFMAFRRPVVVRFNPKTNLVGAPSIVYTAFHVTVLSMQPSYLVAHCIGGCTVHERAWLASILDT